MKIIFFGTPEIAVKTLQVLHMMPDIEIAAVITQPDKETGRKKIKTPPPVKIAAERMQLKVLQPKNKKELLEVLENFSPPDFFVVFAYGMILPEEALKIPKHAAINIHTSLLPKYRGASPIQTALLNGDKETGISIIKMDKEMDHGDIYLLRRIQISDFDNYESLSKKLGEISAITMPLALQDILSQTLPPIKQNHAKAKYCKKIEKKDGEIDFKKSAVEIKNMLKAYTPWPGIFTNIKGKKIEITEMHIDENQSLKPGEFKIEDNSLKIGTSKGILIPKKIKPEGKQEMDTKSFINGYSNLFMPRKSTKRTCP